MRYLGQAYELEVPITAPVTPAQIPEILAAFHGVHERVYGYARPQQPVEFVNFRAVHTYPLPPPALAPAGWAGGSLDDARVRERPAFFEGRFVSTAIYDRSRLPDGARVTGPAIVEQPDTTTVIPPGHAAVVDPSGSLRLHAWT
jgi:N-methylhydantoinase A